MSLSQWNAPIDAYCERTDPSFWSEPINALSNLAFIAAAALAYARWRRAGAHDFTVLLLAILIVVVGTGSLLFHTFANGWSRLADVLPIAIFIYSYFGLAMHRMLGFGMLASAGLTLAFGAFNLAFVRAWVLLFGERGIEATNGSVGYFPAALALIGVGSVLLLRSRSDPRVGSSARRAAGRALLRCAVVFVVSLLFRTIDLAACERWPIGTHFLWHLCNAALLFLLVEAMRAFPRSLPQHPESE